MSGVDSLDALRKRVRLRGQKVGAGKCVWADGFAMETVANHFRLLHSSWTSASAARRSSRAFSRARR